MCVDSFLYRTSDIDYIRNTIYYIVLFRCRPTVIAGCSEARHLVSVIAFLNVI